MLTTTITPEILSASVIAVPPLARRSDLTVARDENRKIIRRIEAGGVSIFLYGGNANFYNVSLAEYRGILEILVDSAAEGSLVIPSVGPAYGAMLDQSAVLKDFDFPTVMVLPPSSAFTARGAATGIRRFADALGKPVVLYLKQDDVLDVNHIARLVDDGLVSWIKYAVVRDDPADDDYLRAIVEGVDPSIVVSGIGEQPAIVHMRDFGLVGFTSGCVCVAPGLAMQMLSAIRARDFDSAERIRRLFRSLEDLRNNINPVRVLHEAVRLAGIADTGPVQPLMTNLDGGDEAVVRRAAEDLAAADRAAISHVQSTGRSDG